MISFEKVKNWWQTMTQHFTQDSYGLDICLHLWHASVVAWPVVLMCYSPEVIGRSGSKHLLLLFIVILYDGLCLKLGKSKFYLSQLVSKVTLELRICTDKSYGWVIYIKVQVIQKGQFSTNWEGKITRK